LKFIRIGEDYQEYGLLIPETMVTDEIKQSESYQMFIKYSTGQIHPKKSRCKEPTKKKTSSKRRFRKKVTLSADDNIISDDPDATLELAKSIIKTKAEDAKATRKVHATHARIMTEYVPESARRRESGKVTFDPCKKVKGVPSLTLEEQEAADIMQALKESKKTKKRQPGTKGSNKGNGSKPRVFDEFIVVFATSSEGTGIKPQEDKDGDADDEDNDHIIDTQDADDEDVETKSDEDDIYKYKIRVRKDEDEEMINAKVDDSDKGDEEITDAAKADAEKTLEVKDDAKKTDLPSTSSSLSISLGFGDQFLKLSSDSSLVSTVKDTTDTKINSLLEVKIQSEVPHTYSSSVLSVHVSVISEPTVPTQVQESPSISTVTTLPPPSISTTPSVPQQTTTPIPTQPITTDAPTITTVVSESDALSAIQLRVAKLEKDMSKLKKIDLSAKALAALKTQVLSVVDNYLGYKVRDIFQKETPTVDLEQGSKKSALEILKLKRKQAEKQQMPKFTIKSTNKATLKEYDLKSALYQSMHANKYFNKNPSNHRLYHALMEALIEDKNVMDKRVTNTVKDHKRKHDDDEDDDDEDPSAGLNQGKQTKRRRTKESESSKKPSSTNETPKGKAPTKGSKTGKSASTKEPVEEPTAEVVMDDAGDDVACDDNQPQGTSEPKTRKTPNPECNIELEYNFQECFNALTDKYDWNNPEGDHYPFDLSKPLPLQAPPGHQTIAADYFFNNDLEYLKTSDPEAVVYTDVYYGGRGFGREGSSCNPRSFSRLRGSLLYPTYDLLLITLCMDLDDMLIFAVQHKLFHLDGSDIADFIVALRMFTRSLILKRRAEDLQLGVESYRKKLNITKPQKTFLEVEVKEPYTSSYDPSGIVYEDLNKQKNARKGKHQKSRAIDWCTGTQDGLQTDDAYRLIVKSNL
nr:hypothetical protein [Tanacetum cinerariifolium]